MALDLSSQLSKFYASLRSFVPLPQKQLHTYTNNTTTKIKWHGLYLAIRCARAFKSLLFASRQRCSPATDATTLSNLVKNKDLSQLSRLGGVKGLAPALKSDINRGIDDTTRDIQYQQNKFGRNKFPKPPTKCFFHFVYDALKDPSVLLLLASASLSLGFDIKQNGLRQGWYEGGSVLIVVLAAICIFAISNFHQDRLFNKAAKFSNNNKQVQVVRGGTRKSVSSNDVVVGEVVRLRTGDQIPADGVIISGRLTVDESSITGESDRVQVSSDLNRFLFSGTKVNDGYGEMLVTSVGMNTTWGEMMREISHGYNEPSPLQERLNSLTSSILKVGLSLSSIVLVVLSVRYYFRGHKKGESGTGGFQGGGKREVVGVVGIIGGAVSILGVTIPMGLPFAVTLTLAYSMKVMMVDKAMVRTLSACETLGSATVICTDKTGTLTMNEMRVTEFWVGQEPIEDVSSGSVSSNVLELTRQGVGLNTKGTAYRPASGTGFEFSGSPTEKALLSFGVHQLNMDFLEQKHTFTPLQIQAFDSDKKRSGVLMKKNADNTIHIHWKGAAEIILAMCSNYYEPNGIIKALDDAERDNFNRVIEGMAASSLRCIAFAHKQVEEDRNPNQKIDDSFLTLLGVVGLKDPCRPGVRNAVEECQAAGVNVTMITGENVFTAKAIATECGILIHNQDNNSGEVVEGAEFRNYTENERMEKVKDIRVMARSSPSDKLLIVKTLMQTGHVVAVTGDGTNDAPALKEADIALAMGIEGTEVAKESSDIVILDDNFTCVPRVLMWGRCVYSKIQKFIQFQLTVTFVALAINFIAVISSGQVPFTALELLWVNLIMDTLGAIALATEPPVKDIMHKPPVGRSDPLITNIMWRDLVAQSMYEIVALLTLQFKGEAMLGMNEKVRDTLIFNVFVLCQVLNDIKEWNPENKNIFQEIVRKKVFWLINVLRIALQALMIEFLKKFAGTSRLSWGQWGMCIAIAVVSWLVAWFVAYVPVPEKPFSTFLTMQNLKHICSACTTYVQVHVVQKIEQLPIFAR